MKKLLILSGKGGTGKTTISAAFIDFLSARAFADCDVDAPNLHLVAGMTGEPELTNFYGAQKAFIDPSSCVGCGLCRDHCRFDAIVQENGKCKINEYACEGCGVCQHVCPQSAVTLLEDIAGEQMLYRGAHTFSTARLKMGRGNSGKLVTAVKSVLIKAATEAEIAVIDGSPGVGCPVIASLSGVDLVLIVAEPSVSGISDMERIIKTARLFQTKVAVCINKADTALDKAKSIEQFCADSEIPFVGCIPYDKQAAKAVNAGHSLAKADCPARNALFSVYQNVIKQLNSLEAY